MELLLYARNDSVITEKLLDAVGEVAGRELIERFGDWQDFTHRLHNPWDQWKAVIILAPTRGELKKTLEMRNVLLDLRLILILSDRNKEGIAAGHLLRPRFICFADGDFQDLKSILFRMFEAGK